MSSPVPTTALAGVPALGMGPDGLLYVMPVGAAGSASQITAATSTTGLTFQVTATITPAPLATAWAVNTAYSLGQVVKNSSNIYRCTTAGTSAASGSGPTTLGAGITDGSAAWKGVGQFVNGFMLTNAAAAGGSIVYWGFSDLTATVGDAIYPGGLGKGISVADPTLIYVVTSSSTAVVTVAGLS